jgi:hypothetical protein
VEFQVVLPHQPQQVLDRPARVHGQRLAPATTHGPEPQSVLNWVRRFWRGLAVLQQPARGGQAFQFVQLQPREQAGEDVVRQSQQSQGLWRGH